MLAATLLSLGAVFLAELGDRSQLITMTYTLRYRWWVVLTGVAIAAFTVHGVAVAIGHFLGSTVPARPAACVSAIAFLIFAVWVWREDTASDSETSPTAAEPRLALFTVVSSFALAELGDKTTLATVTLASDHHWAGVWIGTTLGMILADGLAIGAGLLLHRRLPERLLQVLTGLLFLLFGLWLLFDDALGFRSVAIAVTAAVVLAAATTAVSVRVAQTRRRRPTAAATPEDDSTRPERSSVAPGHPGSILLPLPEVSLRGADRPQGRLTSAVRTQAAKEALGESPLAAGCPESAASARHGHPDLLAEHVGDGPTRVFSSDILRITCEIRSSCGHITESVGPSSGVFVDPSQRQHPIRSGLHGCGHNCRYHDQQIHTDNRLLLEPGGGHIDEHDVRCPPEPPVRHGLSARTRATYLRGGDRGAQGRGHHDVGSYLSQLRSGNRTNPSGATMAALANFFRIKAAYFTDDEYYEKLDKELQWLCTMRDDGVRRIAQRAHGLPSAAQQKVLDRIDELRRAEGIDA